MIKCLGEIAEKSWNQASHFLYLKKASKYNLYTGVNKAVLTDKPVWYKYILYIPK